MLAKSMPRNDYFEAWLRNKTATSSKWSMNLNEKTLILQNLEYTYDGVLHSENVAFEYADSNASTARTNVPS